MKILGLEIKMYKQPNKECEHTTYSYKYNTDNDDLYVCNNCKLVGTLTGGEQIPNSYNMITNSYAYKNRIFTPLTIERSNQ